MMEYMEGNKKGRVEEVGEMRLYEEKKKEEEGRRIPRLVEEKIWCRLMGDKIVISILENT
jgi:hypothetical protein